jgi:hypothetical protein
MPAQYPSVVVAVDDINESMKKVMKAGGKVLGKPMEIPGVGQYVSFFDTEGNQEFTLSVFVDDLYALPPSGEEFTDTTVFTDGTGFIPYSVIPYTPALQLDFIGKAATGYGLQSYGRSGLPVMGNSAYGGGNNTALRTLTLAPTKFTSMKLRMDGQSYGPMKFVAITLLYQQGTIRRMP